MARNTPSRSKQPPRTESAFPIVGVGASAGGLEAFTALLKNLPSDSGMAFVLIQHLDPKHPSQLSELLSKATKMTVREVDRETEVEANHVYVIAPSVCLSLSDGRLRADPRQAGRNLPIDHFLRSLALERESKAIGIVLSGTASDGTLGLKAVKAEGGITFAQEPASAKFDGMPRNAIAAGVIDFVLPPAEIAKRLVRLAQHPYVRKPADDGQEGQETELELNRILHLLRSTVGIDFAHYKHTTIRRRIQRRMVVHTVEKLHDYMTYLQENPAEVRALADDLLIRITSFFREPDSLEGLTTKVFPEVIKARSPEDPLRIWVPGCATGEEAYSIAICLTEFLERTGTNLPIQIFATDVSEAAIEKARAGIFGTPSVAEVSPERLKRFFAKGDGGYRIHKSIRENCIFAKQNITRDPPFHKLDLITCCNVLIYFGPVLQRKALSIFHYALKPGGFLMLGPSETVGALSNSFAPVDKKVKLYRKQGSDPVHFQYRVSEPAAKAANDDRPADNVRLTLDVQKTAERMLLAQYAPAGVIADDALNVIHVRGEIEPYLQVPPGEPSYGLLKMAREGLAVGLRTAVLKARQKKGAVSQQARAKYRGQFRDVNVKVVPINGTGRAEAVHFMILFEDIASPAPPAADSAVRQKTGRARPANDTGSRNAQENARLKEELAATREYLQSIIEEQEASTEELKSANEEAQASNEELETAREELQSANEELNTLNDELKTRNAALTETNNDLANVLTGINVPLVFVGKDLNIRRFTPSIVPMLNLIDTDIGRSILDLKPNIDIPDLRELLQGVVSGGRPGTREVKDPKGRWYSLQALPYKTSEGKIAGALLALLDVDAVKRGRDYARSIVETVRQPLLVLTKELIVTDANQAFYEAFQVSPKETKGRFVYDLGNGQWNIPRLREALERILPEQGTLVDFEVAHRFDTIGRRVMVLNARELQETASGEPSSILLAIEDITERRHSEEVRREGEERYRTLFDLGPVAVYSCDVSGVIHDYNRRAAELWGRTPKAGDTDERFCGSFRMHRPDGTFMPHDQCPMAEVLAGKIPEARDMEVDIERPDGSRITAIVNIRVLKNERGEITGAVNCFVDITLLKEAENALRKSEARLQRANDDLHHFAFAASHDLQEPLRMVTSYAQLLSREYKGSLGENADQYIAYTVEGARRMEALLKGMREYWQASERGEEHHAAVDCNEAVNKAVLNLQESITNSGAVITRDSLPTVWAEETMLAQLFQNLIGNAIKYRSKKPPQVHVSAAKNSAEEWVFSVKDNGIGIEPQYAEKVFTMFSRLNGNKYQGSGIGLALCRKVAEHLGGRIWVESKKGHGAVFKFSIPSKGVNQ